MSTSSFEEGLSGYYHLTSTNRLAAISLLGGFFDVLERMVSAELNYVIYFSCVFGCQTLRGFGLTCASRELLIVGAWLSMAMTVVVRIRLALATKGHDFRG